MSKKSPVTIKFIAKELDLGESTVSRVLNGLGKKYRISEKTINTITEAAKEMNFSPNQIARSLRMNKTFTIGLIVPDITNPFFANMASTIEKEARALDYNTFLCDSDKTTSTEVETLKLLIDRKVDGLIVSPIGLESGHLSEAHDNGTPLVLIDRFFTNTQIPHVSSDDKQGAKEAVSHLIEMGHKKIICIQGLAKTSQNSLRVEGYLQALKEYNIPLDPELVVGNDFGEQNGYDQAKLFIRIPEDSRPTAIFSVSNLITLGILKAFKENGIVVPRDVSIVSYDEQSYSDLLLTPMTTVSQSTKQMSSIALQLLLDQINSPQQSYEAHSMLPTKMIFRDSVKRI